MPFINVKHRHWNILIKVALTAGLCWVIYREVFQIADFTQLAGLWYSQWQSATWWWMLLAVVLIPFNWGLEAGKWRLLMRPFWKMSFRESYQGVLTGIVFSLFTPNRVGEYGGRVLAVPAKYNWYAVLSTLVGSYAQLLVLLSGGLFGVLYFIQQYELVSQFLMNGFWWISFVLLVLATFFYLNINLLIRLIKILPVPRLLVKYIRYFYRIRHYKRSILGGALALAFIRYGIYSFQYFCVIRFFGIEAPFLGAICGIASIFLIQSSVPLPPLAALLARGEAALIIWGNFSDNKLGILAATFSLFIINLCVPALLGMVFVFKINVLKSLGYEQKLPQKSHSSCSDAALSGLHANGSDNTESQE